MGVTEEQGRDFSCRQECFSSLCPVAASLSKQRDFLPSMVPVHVCHTALLLERKGRGTRHAQDPKASWA
jgi:hypothetical protein